MRLAGKYDLRVPLHAFLLQGDICFLPVDARFSAAPY